MGYMIEVRETETFTVWLLGLKDQRAVARITERLHRAGRGLFGDVEPVGEGVSEMRVDYGPGYRVYFVRRGETLVVLLCGGDKRRQKRDIKRAKAMAKEV